MPAFLSEVKRQKWKGRFDFILVSIGYAVGLGNIWRFPYMCFESGGGAFLIPYFIMLILCGIPLMYLEVAIGQYTQQGPIGAIAKICPLFKGAGIATVIITYLFLTYYNVILSWAFFYMFSSFKTPLPWTYCDPAWRTDLCWDYRLNSTNETRSNDSVSPSEEFYRRVMLKQSKGLGDPGTIRWELALILLLSWIIVYFCVFKGTSSTGRVVYVTATVPYLMLLVMLVRGLTLTGSMDGVYFFIRPKWHHLKNIEVWLNAAIQNFHSIGIGFGGHIAMSSYNKFNNNIFRDVITVTLANALTSILSGFVIFSILGHVAFMQGKKVENVTTEGTGLVFITYPAAFASMPGANFFAFIFFFMLILLGIDSVFASIEVVITTLQDHFSKYIIKYIKRKELLVLLVVCVTYIAGLPHITQGGIYFFRLVDYYSATLSLFCLAFLEVVSVTWIYGVRRLANNIEEMTGKRPNKFFMACWLVVSPVLIFAIWMFSFNTFKTFKLGTYEYPPAAVGLGWLIACFSLLCIPASMIHSIVTANGDTYLQKFLNSLKSPMSETYTAPSPAECNGDEKSTNTAIIPMVPVLSDVSKGDYNSQLTVDSLEQPLCGNQSYQIRPAQNTML